MTINQLRTVLYKVAKYLGDVQALTSKKPGAIPKRIARRLAGRATGKLLGRLFK